jgi:hypothetical protein
MATVIISERQDEINAVLHPRLQILQVLFIHEKKFTVIFILITNNVTTYCTKLVKYSNRQNTTFKLTSFSYKIVLLV